MENMIIYKRNKSQKVRDKASNSYFQRHKKIAMHAVVPSAHIAVRRGAFFEIIHGYRLHTNENKKDKHTDKHTNA